jgi:DNA-binding Lrp family transcriptional regulator
MSHHLFFVNGPFHHAATNAEDFALGMYYTYRFAETMEELNKVEKEYILALSSSDDALIKVKQSQLSFYENIIVLATKMMDSSPSDSGSLYD